MSGRERRCKTYFLHLFVCVCVRERERECVCVCEWLEQREREREGGRREYRKVKGFVSPIVSKIESEGEIERECS